MANRLPGILLVHSKSSVDKYRGYIISSPSFSNGMNHQANVKLHSIQCSLSTWICNRFGHVMVIKPYVECSILNLM